MKIGMEGRIMLMMFLGREAWVLELGNGPFMMCVANRCGCPQGSRPRMWEAALCLSPLRPQDIEVFASLCTSAISQVGGREGGEE
jgi:hypothetical protein